MFHTEQQYVNDGFQTRFEFRISEIDGDGADGILFQLHKDSTGFFRVFMDTYNPGFPNLNQANVRLVTPNQDTKLFQGDLPFNASDGEVHSLELNFNGSTQQLTITTDDALLPFVDVLLDLEDLDLIDGFAWVGF